jgi:hypothetical protein
LKVKRNYYLFGKTYGCAFRETKGTFLAKA